MSRLKAIAVILAVVSVASCAGTSSRRWRPEPKHTDTIVRVVPDEDDGISVGEVIFAGLLICSGLEALELLEAGEVATAVEAEEGMAAAGIGEYGEARLARQVGGRSQVRIGSRIYDQFAAETAYEAKTGYKLLTPQIRSQVLADTGNAVEWHFYRSPMTGLRGPSPQLAALLNKSRIKWVVH
jgi:hypothetical protein